MLTVPAELPAKHVYIGGGGGQQCIEMSVCVDNTLITCSSVP